MLCKRRSWLGAPFTCVYVILSQVDYLCSMLRFKVGVGGCVDCVVEMPDEHLRVQVQSECFKSVVFKKLEVVLVCATSAYTCATVSRSCS